MRFAVIVIIVNLSKLLEVIL